MARAPIGTLISRTPRRNHGLGTSVLVGQRSAEAAMQVARHHLRELFGR
jgi:hypothetical protein